MVFPTACYWITTYYGTGPNVTDAHKRHSMVHITFCTLRKHKVLKLTCTQSQSIKIYAWWKHAHKLNHSLLIFVTNNGQIRHNTDIEIKSAHIYGIRHALGTVLLHFKVLSNVSHWFLQLCTSESTTDCFIRISLHSSEPIIPLIHIAYSMDLYPQFGLVIH